MSLQFRLIHEHPRQEAIQYINIFNNMYMGAYLLNTCCCNSHNQLYPAAALVKFTLKSLLSLGEFTIPLDLPVPVVLYGSVFIHIYIMNCFLRCNKNM